MVEVDEADVADLLHLSINSTDAAPPYVVEDLLRILHTMARLSTAEVLGLLRTAVERNRIEVLSSMLRRMRTSSLGKLAPEQLLPILKRAIVLDANTPVPPPSKSAASKPQRPVSRLGQATALPAARRLPADAVAALIDTALQVGTSSSLKVLCELPAARDITSPRLADIVEAALMGTAVEARITSNLKVLCQLPAAKAISPAQLASLVEPTAAKEDHAILRLLAKATAFPELPPAAVAAALQAAVQLPAAADLQGRHLGQLLRCAAAAAPPASCMQRPAEVVECYLVQHPAWSSVSDSDKQAWQQRQALQDSEVGGGAPSSLEGTGDPSMNE
uniref:Symplekin C-terminal domain-containing protein n=1 Tax=Tetradesmus obliquus TaxID=3088 RepID=A0A383WJM3_TETOB|eukprot:jgi/Sobl393_1/17867/SZX77422.1